MQEGKRYYFHGDVVERGRYYCARCDMIVETSHYYEFKHSPSDKGDEDIMRFRRMKKAGVPKGFFRLENAENFIE